jgi:hypothetical protein
MTQEQTMSELWRFGRRYDLHEIENPRMLEAMRICMIGLRGIPNVQGGVETHVEQLVSNLVELGADVHVFARKWFDVVSWAHYAMINAEELGITSKNVDEQKSAANPDIKRLLGTEEGTKIGTDLGLTNEWAYNIIKHVGNYGEVFDRNVGAGSPLKIERGLNALWTKGGLQYAPPVR